MFSTENFEGRLRYETDKVVCIDVYSKCDHYPGEFIAQVLLSLVTKKYHVNVPFCPQYVKVLSNELDVGIRNYLKIREELELD